MPIEIKSIKGYYYLDAWVMSHIIHQATISFCRRYLNKDNDPGGRLYDQMVMAARSASANIAEGSSRRQTSRETEMRLTDVARATLCELLSDFMAFSLTYNIEPWAKDDENYRILKELQLEQPNYGPDIERDAWLHVQAQRERFAPWTESNDLSVRVNSIKQLINLTIFMLQKMIAQQLDDFKHTGGFTEGLAQERVATQSQHSLEQGAPLCPRCGKPMIRRTIKRGTKAGQQFWGCSGYPKCPGTRRV
ncbi:MAG: four helix bundle protein [Muribaculaceae bacterium]|nr:four helix bundle protein [Muribaculaceae bacterium]